MIIEVTDIAKKQLDEVIDPEETEKRLRVYVANYGWGGPILGMALEEPEEEDLAVDAQGYKFLIGDGLEDAYSKLEIDYNTHALRRGFVINPKK